MKKKKQKIEKMEFIRGCLILAILSLGGNDKEPTQKFKNIIALLSKKLKE